MEFIAALTFFVSIVLFDRLDPPHRRHFLLSAAFMDSIVFIFPTAFIAFITTSSLHFIHDMVLMSSTAALIATIHDRCSSGVLRSM